MYAFNFKCHNCKRSAQSKGIYNKVRLVPDVKDFYYLATEYMDVLVVKPSWHQTRECCNSCHYHMTVQFPVILTYQYAYDNAVIALLK